MESQCIKFRLEEGYSEEDPLKNVQSNSHHKLSLTDTNCATVSVEFGGRNSSIATLLSPASFATELHEDTYWEHLPALFFIFAAAFRVFEVI